MKFLLFPLLGSVFHFLG